MTAIPDATRARRYLLRDVSDRESELIEQEYLEHEEAVDRIAAAEDELIEDYLSDQLTASERDRFEHTYLSVPHHRVRVETVRRLMSRASRSGSTLREKGTLLSWRRVTSYSPWLALAASVLVIASIALWNSPAFREQQGELVENPTAPPAPGPVEPATAARPSPPRIFAVTLSPVTVRSAGENPTVGVPPGTETIVVRLESDVDVRKLVARRASVQTVGGDEVWQGAVTAESNAPAGAVARADIPAASLPADDYVVILFATDQAGVEQEWNRYFLRLRTQ